MIVLLVQGSQYKLGAFFLCILVLYTRKKKQIYIYILLLYIYLYIYIYEKFLQVQKAISISQPPGAFSKPGGRGGGGMFSGCIKANSFTNFSILLCIVQQILDKFQIFL